MIQRIQKLKMPSIDRKFKLNTKPTANMNDTQRGLCRNDGVSFLLFTISSIAITCTVIKHAHGGMIVGRGLVGRMLGVFFNPLPAALLAFLLPCFLPCLLGLDGATLRCFWPPSQLYQRNGHCVFCLWERWRLGSPARSMQK
jgi:hypothetical protein